MKIKNLIIATVACTMLSCNQQPKGTDAPPVQARDTATSEENVLVTQNKGFADGVDIDMLHHSMHGAYVLVDSVISNESGSTKGFRFETSLTGDSTYYNIDVYHPENSAGHSQSDHLFFFPRTKKLFYYTFGGDSLNMREVSYDTSKYRFVIRKK